MLILTNLSLCTKDLIVVFISTSCQFKEWHIWIPFSSAQQTTRYLKKLQRALSCAEEIGESHAIMSYDLAVATKAYSIQALESISFDNVLILVGNFYLKKAYFGALGTFINETGISDILIQAGILAEGSLMALIKGKYYKRCTPVHEILALTSG